VREGWKAQASAAAWNGGGLKQRAITPDRPLTCGATRAEIPTGCGERRYALIDSFLQERFL